MSAALKDILIARIQDEGPITIADYMDAALGHSEYGYYMTKDPFGLEGDFTTAPEISQMFGEVIAAWLIDLWQQYGAPSEFNLVELGPGRGTLMSDILRTAEKIAPSFITAVHIHLVETSPFLRKHQKESLSTYDVKWHSNINDIPQGFCLFVANELFDALPIQQFMKADIGWQERRVDYDHAQDAFVYSYKTVDDGIVLPENMDTQDIYEYSETSLSLMRAMSERISAQGGAALIIDYGYTQRDIKGDSLQAVKDHQYTDVLTDPGTADITAHVDFAALQNTAQDIENIAVSNVVDQGDFLNALGLMQRAEALLANADTKQANTIRQAYHRLTAPREMGTLFKVMGVWQDGLNVKPAGF